MVIREDSGIKYYQFPSMNRFPYLFHGFFSRHGGYSRPPYQSLNVALKVGDRTRDVSRNISKIGKILKASKIVSVTQEHGCNIIIIDKNYLKTYHPRTPPVSDALITAETGIALLIKVADCQAVFLLDTVRKVIANIHCGWRGNVKNIIGKTVDAMKGVFGSKPGDMIAAISPSLGPCCAEFKDYKRLLPRKFNNFKIGQDHFDFWQISRAQLVESGIDRENIEIAEICTVCNSENFFSYRKEKTTGRCAAMMMLRDTS